MKRRSLWVWWIAVAALAACEDEAKPRGGLVEIPGSESMAPRADGGPPDAPPDTPPTGPEDPPPPEARPVRLRVTSPARGHRATGRFVAVEGVLEGGVAPHLAVDGRPVQVGPDGRFSADVAVEPGVNMLVTTVVDDTGDLEDRRAALIDGDVDPRSMVRDAAGVHVSRPGFTAIGALITDALDGVDLGGLVAGNVPEGITINDLRYDRLEVQLVPLRGLIEARLRLYGLYVDLDGEVSFGVSFTVSGSASADPAEVVAQIAVEADGRGGLDITVEGAEVTLRQFDYDIEWVPDFVESWFSDRVQEFAQGLLEDAVRGFIVPALFDPSALERTIDVLGTEVALGLRIEDVDVAPEGLTMAMDGHAEASRVVHDGGAVPVLGGEPTFDKSTHIDLAAAADLVARVLHAAWAGGALDVELGPGGDFELPVPLTTALVAGALGPAAEGLDRQAPLRVRMRPLLPPEVRVEQGEKPLVIEFGDLLFDLISATDGPLVTVAADVVSRAAVRVTGLESIELGADLDVEVHADVAETPRGPVDDARLEALLEGLAAAIPGLLADQTFTFGADVLPVPVRFTNPRFEADRAAEFVHVRAGIGGP